MVTYKKLQNDMQLTTLALTALAAEKSKETTDKWLNWKKIVKIMNIRINLILFRVPKGKNNPDGILLIQIHVFLSTNRSGSFRRREWKTKSGEEELSWYLP